MTATLLFCLITSLKITAIHVCCWHGNILAKPAEAVAVFAYKKFKDPEIILKPLYDCLVCMSSFWGLLFWLIDGANYEPIEVVLIVCGINAIFSQFIYQKPPAE